MTALTFWPHPGARTVGMDQAGTFADRTALLSLWLLAAFNALLFLVFVAGLAAAGTRLDADAAMRTPPPELSRPA